MRRSMWYLGVTVMILSAFATWEYSLIRKATAEKKRLSSNVEALLSDIEVYRIMDSINVSSVQSLSLKLSDYKRFREQDAEMIKKLNFKIKNLESVSKSSIASNYKIKTITEEIQRDSIRIFNYKTPYIDIEGKFEHDSVSMNISSFDTLFQVVHRVPRKFLFLRVGTKAIRQEVLSTNPHTNITYSEYITIHK